MATIITKKDVSSWRKCWVATVDKWNTLLFVKALDLLTVLQAATILVAMASEKKFWQWKFWWKSPIGDQQIKRETYLKNYQ